MSSLCPLLWNVPALHLKGPVIISVFVQQNPEFIWLGKQLCLIKNHVAFTNSCQLGRNKLLAHQFFFPPRNINLPTNNQKHTFCRKWSCGFTQLSEHLKRTNIFSKQQLCYTTIFRFYIVIIFVGGSLIYLMGTVGSGQSSLLPSTRYLTELQGQD